MKKNDRLYTKEADGTIQTWYFDRGYGNQFSVATVRNAKLRDYKRYFDYDDVGQLIFLSRIDAAGRANND